MTRLTWLAALACVAPPLAAQQTTPPTSSALAAITARGRALAAYDQAAWHGTDAMMALHPAHGSMGQYIARRTDAGWTVVFGHLSAGCDTFFIAYEAVPAAHPTAAQRYVGVAHQVSVADTGYYRRAANAIVTAEADFGKVSRPYNVAALPAPEHQWWVYLVPAPTVVGVWPLGGDTRYLISADGAVIVKRRRLHKDIIEFRPGQVAPSPDSRLKAGAHTAVLDNIPEDTDVFYVLTRTPHIPEYIVTDLFVYRIDTNGVIRLLGRRDKVLGESKK